MKSGLWVCIVCVLAAHAPAGRAADGDPVRVTLERAKAVHSANLDNYRTAVAAWFDKREEAARKNGDKMTVDQVKAERQVFADNGDLPKTAPTAFKSQIASTRSALKTAYQSAIREYIKAKQDDDAAAIEKELDKLQREVASADPADAKLFLKNGLGNTKWKWPDEKVKNAWFVLNADGTVTAGWHSKGGSWEVVSGTTIRAVVRASDRTPRTMTVDLKAGTIYDPKDNAILSRLK